MPWGQIVSMALTLIGMGIKAKGNDDEVQNKFNELADILAAKKITSANVKLERDGRLARLKKKVNGEDTNV